MTATLKTLCAFLASGMMLAVANADSVDMAFLAELRCFDRTQDIIKYELMTVFDLIPKVNLSSERVYTICPNTEITVGIQDFETRTFSRGGPPIAIFAPNVHIKCGETGESRNNCLVLSGQEQLTSLAGDGFLDLLLSWLAEEDLPEEISVDGLGDYTTDTSNLIVKGLTFEDAFDVDEVYSKSAVYFPAPGTEMLMDDCIFRDSNRGFPPSNLVSTTYFSQFHDGEGFYTSFSLKRCVFEDNTVTGSIVGAYYSLNSEEVPYERDISNVVRVDIEECLFVGNTVLEDSEVAAVVFLPDLSLGSVKSTCFVDNVNEAASIKGSPVIFSNPEIKLLSNFAAANDATAADGSDKCNSIARVAAYKFARTGELWESDTFCQHFDAKSCQVVHPRNDNNNGVVAGVEDILNSAGPSFLAKTAIRVSIAGISLVILGLM